MIISSSQSPQKSLLIIGANILKILREHSFESTNPLILMSKYNDIHDEISFSYLILALDWLFLIDTIKLTDTGDIKLCN
ncbi:ABC-three component system middle component 6 [Shewanella mangrovisoli]|uniref:ABC-three component system middle component 6 n=1 Tax=Shewanella mangrovisoli TaxID=2864211 RepID=UPI0035B7CB6C